MGVAICSFVVSSLTLALCVDRYTKGDTADSDVSQTAVLDESDMLYVSNPY